MPLEIQGTEGEQRNPTVHINPDPQLLGAFNPLRTYPLGLSSKCILFSLLYFIKSLLFATLHLLSFFSEGWNST